MSKHSTKHRHGSAVVTIASQTDVLITHAFDAPAALIFDAYTKPELVRRWWGFETSEILVCEIDLRVGGQWRFVTRDEGQEVGFHGEYQEIDQPHRLVSTEIYEGLPDTYPADAAVNIMTLTEIDGVTTLTLLVKMPSMEARDLMLESGMEGGLQIGYDRLEDLVRDMT